MLCLGVGTSAWSLEGCKRSYLMSDLENGMGPGKGISSRMNYSIEKADNQLSKTKRDFWCWCLGRRKAEPAILLVLCPECWHARACPKSVCHFFQLALVLGACRVTEAHGWVSSRSECDANKLQWAPKLVRWEAALWACAFSNLLTAPPALLHPHRQTSRGQTNLHALPLAICCATCWGDIDM